MKPTRVFYDDMYLYQEFTQTVEGQAAPVVFKIATGPKPEFAGLAAHIEGIYAKAYQTVQNGNEADPAAVLAAMFAGAPKPGLPTEHYAEHTLFVTRLGTVWHLEYHSYPEPVLYFLAEADKAARREKGSFTRAILYDQSYTIDGQEYIVTSLRGNYADFPNYSPFVLNKEQTGIQTLDQAALLDLGATFEKAERGEGNRLDAETFFREKLIPLMSVNCFRIMLKSHI